MALEGVRIRIRIRIRDFSNHKSLVAVTNHEP